MNPSDLESPNKVQRVFEKLLLVIAAVLVLFHMIISSYKNALPNRWFFRHMDEWFGLILLISVFVYLLYVFFAWPEKRKGFKNVIRQFNAYEYWFSFFLVFWYALSCALWQHMTGQASFKDNDWWLYITWLMSFVVFPFARVVGTKPAKKYVDSILSVILIPHIIFFAWLLWNYFNKNYVTLPSGNALEMTPGPGLAAGENRNNTAATALTMMGLCWYMVVSRESFRKLPYALGVAVYLAILILTNSRTSWYAGLVLFVIIVFRFTWNSLRKKGQILRILAGLVCAAACVLLLNSLRGELFELLDRSVNFTGQHPASAQTADWYHNDELAREAYPMQLAFRKGSATNDSVIQPEELSTAADYARTAEIGLRGRKEIYQACIHVMFSRKYIFLFGVTHAKVPDIIYGVCGVDKFYSDAHNYWLQMGVAFGVPMLLAALAFTFLLVLRCLRILFCEREDQISGAWTIPALVLSTFVFELAETQISSGSLIVCPAFYLFAGWVVAMDLEMKSKKKEEKPV